MTTKTRPTPDPSPAAWPMPFSRSPVGVSAPVDGEGARGLTHRQWGGLVAAFCVLHYGALLVSVVTGNFDPAPNHDHVHVARQVLAEGYPTIAIWPPAFGYLIAFKMTVAAWLGVPYWTGKLWADTALVAASGALSTLLALRLTRNRFVAVCSGLGLVAAPIFALASPEDLAVILFQPIFLGALVLLVDGLQTSETDGRGRLARFGGFGALLGLSCLVRANPQFLIPVLLPFVWWQGRRARWPRPFRLAATVLGVALTAQVLVLLPWSLVQRATAGESGVFAAPVVYYAYFDGMRRHEGFEVSDALRQAPEQPPLSLEGVVDFNLEWLRRDPVALAKLYVVKLVRTWYLSDSGRWDRWIAVLHAPWWILGLAGAVRWWRRAPREPALLLVVLVIGYLWGVSALVSGLARYMAPVYGLLGLLAGVALLPAAAEPGSRQP